MKFSFIAASAAAAALGSAALAGAAQAQDQAPPPPPGASPFSSTTFYGTLGYTDHGVYGADLGTVDGRLGARFGRYLGVEGEFSGGVNSKSFAPGDKAGINDQETIYGVGYLPITPNIDLFARVGVGRTQWDYKGAGHPSDGDHNWNWGAGGQYFFTAKDGVRAEYTKENFSHAPDGDDWSVSYVRKF